jgi:hypothetical protein
MSTPCPDIGSDIGPDIVPYLFNDWWFPQVLLQATDPMILMTTTILEVMKRWILKIWSWYKDQDPHVPPTTTANLGPYARFLENMPDFVSLTQEEYNTSFQAAFNQPIFGPPPPGISIHEAIQASYYTSYTYQVVCRVRYRTRYHCHFIYRYHIRYHIWYRTRYHVRYLTGWIGSALG